MIQLDQPYTSSLFSLSLTQQEELMYMKMQTHTHFVNTADLPRTLPILKKLCPRVLKTKCFNENNLPFREEVKQTEIGHMFEHVILAYLSEMYATKGIMNVVFNGQTNWNWQIDKRGTFHIYISPINRMPSILQHAVYKAVIVTEIIMKSNGGIKVS
jgi:hypothetical protein